MSVKYNPRDRVTVTQFRYNPGSSISLFSLSNIQSGAGDLAGGGILVWDDTKQAFTANATPTFPVVGGTYSAAGPDVGQSIQIRYSDTQTTPIAGSLAVGELNYSLVPDPANGGETLYIGDAAGDPVAIGSKRIYDYANHPDGVVSANSILITGVDGNLDQLKIGDMILSGDTITVDNGGSNLNLVPGTLGNVSASGFRVVNVADPIDPQDALTLNYLQTQYARNLTLSVDSAPSLIDLKTDTLRFESSNTVTAATNANGAITFHANVAAQDTHVLISPAAPTGVVEGDIWYDSGSTGRSYVFDGSIWVDMNPNDVPDVKALVHVDTVPASPLVGEVWYDTATTTGYVWSGSAWVPFSDPDKFDQHVTLNPAPPVSALVGDLWYDDSTGNMTSGRTYVWDGAQWLDVAPYQAQPSSNALISISTTAPATPDIGQAWYDAGTTGRTYTWDGQQWVDLNPQGMSSGDSKTAITISSVAPANPWIGQPYYDPMTTTGYIWTGSYWMVFSDPDDGSPHVTIQPTEPAPGTYEVGDIWRDTSADNTSYVWDGSSWIELSPHPDNNEKTIIVSDFPPIAPTEGTAWYDSGGSGRTFVYDGNIWIDIAPQSETPPTNGVVTYNTTAPTAPQIGEVWFDPSVNQGFTWDGGNWQLIMDPNDAVPHVTIANTAPTAEVGDIWYDTANTARSYVWDGSTWLDMNPDTSNNAAVGLVVVSNNPPSTPEVGQAWFDSDSTGRTFVWDGSIWVDMAPQNPNEMELPAAEKLYVIVNDQPPVNPDVGMVWYDSDLSGRAFVWDGTQWVDLNPAIASAATIDISDSAPSNPSDGNLWYDSQTTFRTYVWNGSSWADASPVVEVNAYTRYFSDILNNFNNRTVSVNFSGKNELKVELMDINLTGAGVYPNGVEVVGLTNSGRSIIIGEVEFTSAADYPFSTVMTVPLYNNLGGAQPSSYLSNKYPEYLTTVTIKPKNPGDLFVNGSFNLWVK